jgi:hypothetical protein
MKDEDGLHDRGGAIGFIEGDEGTVHPTCKDVVAATVSYVETNAPFW